MLNVKLTTCAPHWPWARQTPGGSLVWEGVRFHVDTEVDQCDAWIVFESLPAAQSTACPPGRTVFITGEPETLGAYPEPFLAQFAHVVTGRSDIAHPGLIRRQQGHPWFVEKSYDELHDLPPPRKSADVCLVTSDKVLTQGHRERLQFALDLKARLGARLDLWGRGLRSFESSWDVLSRYRYAVVLENHSGPDWLTEKLPDALLAWCVPLYHGCTNVADYLPVGSWIDLPALDADAAAHRIETLLADPGAYESRLPELAAARRRYLDELQFFANAAAIVRQVAAAPAEPPATVRLHPAGGVPMAGEQARDPSEAGPLDRKLAGALRVSGWRFLEWADELRPVPAPPEPPPPPPPTLKEVAHVSWMRADGDQTLRMDYPIGAGEVVLDVGGFEGQWASDIFARYVCTVHVFEPVPHFAEAIRRRFARNPHVRLHEVALGGADARLAISIDGNASSTVVGGGRTTEIPVRRFSDVVQEHGWTEIALMKVNIEGGEYELLEHMLDQGLAPRVRNLQVQFHDFVPDAHARMLAIQERLRATHELTYCFPFVWENWQRKDSAP
jgi:FkbM family methyltransferase